MKPKRMAGSSQRVLSVMVVIASMVTTQAANDHLATVLPLPAKVETRPGQFALGPQTRLLVEAVARPAGEFLAARVRGSTGFTLAVEESAATPAQRKGVVMFRSAAQAQPGFPQEGYRLEVTPDSVTITASAPVGFFYGAQTLLQLLPPQAFSARPQLTTDWHLGCLTIEDQPRFEWRGFLLDSARHFFSKEEVKSILESIAMLKLNRFQWHLTDDQGWRVEIKRHPDLTRVGAWRKSIGFQLDPKSSTAYGPDGRYGGFYSQADLREIAAYAAARHITIVPEIEMPGHASAALSVYPELSCGGGPYNTDMHGGVFAGVYCVGNEKTFEFLQEVLTEVMEVFPGKYLHIGGDEVPKDNWRKCAKCQNRIKQEGLKNEAELQSYFIRRIERFIESKGRVMVGWSEIREGGLAKNAVLMDWIGGAPESAREGHNVVMTPTAFCYLDYYQATNGVGEPRAIGGFVPLDKVYAFEPIPAGLESERQRHILGGQGNLWTEYIASLSHAQYMMFPRLAALSEATWSPAASRDYDGFTRRLQVQFERWDFLGVNYRKQIPRASP